MFEAVSQLPEHERAAMTLFYIGGYSMDEVATFLEVPVSTVKGRLHSARERLRTMLLDKVADDLRARRPSRNESFATTVVDLLQAARAGDIERVKTLLKAEPRLLVAATRWGTRRPSSRSTAVTMRWPICYSTPVSSLGCTKPRR